MHSQANSSASTGNTTAPFSDGADAGEGNTSEACPTGPYAHLTDSAQASSCEEEEDLAAALALSMGIELRAGGSAHQRTHEGGDGDDEEKDLAAALALSMGTEHAGGW